MNYADIKPLDIANGPGIRVSLFVSGCQHHCDGCFNHEAWDYDYGTQFTWETIHELEELIRKPQVAGFSILGGEPLDCYNRVWVELTATYIKHNCDKPIWVWTGYEWDQVKDMPIMRSIDVLVDGPFVKELKDMRLKWCGSSNQSVIDVQRSLAAGEVVLYEE